MELTAASKDFPVFKDQRRIICWNLREGDSAGLNLPCDPFFHWQGSYSELSSEGDPVDPVWSAKISEFSSKEGRERVCKFCTSLQANERAFYAPGKARRWSSGMLGPDGVKPTTAENVLIRRTCDDGQVQWVMQELPEKGEHPEAIPLSGCVLQRITYHSLLLRSDTLMGEYKSAYVQDGSQAAWLDGSTLIRAACHVSAERCHVVDKIPMSFAPVRFVPLESRDVFLRCVKSTPTIAITGATLCFGSPFASPLSSKVALTVGKELGKCCKESGIKVMVSASMRAHRSTMSADHDFTLGFTRGSPDCTAVHFKGSNAVMLHGNAWSMSHGVSYIMEEEALDFSNHAKEAALVSSCLHAKSVALLANGGPTVAINLTRFLLLCRARHVFTLCGLHSASGASGAAGSFKQSEEQLMTAIKSAGRLAPNVLGELTEAAAANIIENLSTRPLTLMDLTAEGCCTHNFVLKPEGPNLQASPGLAEGQEDLAVAYAKQCAEHILSTIRLAETPAACSERPVMAPVMFQWMRGLPTSVLSWLGRLCPCP